MKKIIFEEIGRINELMGTESKLITEQAKFLSKIGDELWGFMRTVQKGFVQKDIDDIVLKGKRNGVESLSEKEIQTLMKHLDLARLAKKYYDEGLIISKGSLSSTISGRIEKLKEDGVDTYLNMVNGIKDAARNDFFGLIPGFKEEYYGFADEFAEKLIQDINTSLQEREPELWKEILDIVRRTQKSDRNFIKSFKEFLDGIDLKNVQTISRVLVRSRKAQDKLRNEFVQVSQEMANAIAAGKTTDYYEKKLTDILTSSKKTYRDSIENIYRKFKQDPEFPKGQMMRDFETSGDYSKLMEVIKENPSWGKILREDASAWIQLFNFKKFFTSEFWTGWWNLILKGSPVTFEQISQRLQRKGLRGYFISQVFGAYLIKFIIFPTLYTFFNTILAIIGEFTQWMGAQIGIETVWDPKQSGELWSDLVSEAFMSAIPKDLRLVLPWNSLIDNIIIAAINNNPKAAEDYIDNTIRPDVLDGANKIKEGKIDEIKEVLIEDDLKQLIPEEFHKFLGRRTDGKYEIRSPKDNTSSLIYKAKTTGEWGIEAKFEDGSIRLLSLNDPAVIESLKSWMQ